jgi:hypothetical protein
LVDLATGTGSTMSTTLLRDRPMVQMRLAEAEAIVGAVRAVDIVFHAAGTNAVYRKNPLERYFRDIHVAVQHAAALPLHIEAAGKVMMGHPLSEVGW